MPPQLKMSKSNIIGHPGSNYYVLPSYYSNQNSYAETLAEVLMNEAHNLYDKMVKDFTNQTMSDLAMGSLI
jgi:hypothetical protein